MPELEINVWHKFSNENAKKLSLITRGDLKFGPEMILKYMVQLPTGNKGIEYSLGRVVLGADNKFSVVLDKDHDYVTNDPTKRVKILFQEFFLFKL